MNQTSSHPNPSLPRRILFVCSGNTCRSPMAEAVARSSAESLGLGEVVFRSAGTSAAPGSPASQGARAVSRKNGLDLESHRSSLLSRDLVEWADLVLTMSHSHLSRALELGGEGKAQLLGAFAAGPGTPVADFSVPDPYGGDDETYEATFDIIRGYVRRALERLNEGGRAP